MAKDKDKKKDKKKDGGKKKETTGPAPPSSIEDPQRENPQGPVQPEMHDVPLTEPKEPVTGSATGGAKPKQKKKEDKKDKAKDKKTEKKEKEKKVKKPKKESQSEADITPGHESQGEGGNQGPRQKTPTTQPKKRKLPFDTAKIIRAIKGPEDPFEKPQPLINSGNVLYVIGIILTLIGFLTLIAGYTVHLELGEWGQHKEILIQRVLGAMMLGVGILTIAFKLFFSDFMKARPRYNHMDYPDPTVVKVQTPESSVPLVPKPSVGMSMQAEPTLSRVYHPPEEIEMNPPFDSRSGTSSDATTEKPSYLKDSPPGRREQQPGPTEVTAVPITFGPGGQLPAPGQQGQKKCTIM